MAKKKRSDIPIEERDYSHIHFFFSGLLALVTFWAVLDMIWVRSPWQRTQREFNQTEASILQSELDQHWEDFYANGASEQYEALGQQLEEAKEALQSEEYQQAVQDSIENSVTISKAVQKYRFAKSEADAEYYLYKEAQYHEDEEAYEKHGKRLAELNEEAAKWKKQWDDAEEDKVAIQKRLAKYRQNITQLENQMAELTKEMEDLDFRLERIGERKIEIKQVVMPEFVKGNFGAFLNRVDRCHTCHVAYNRRGFEGLEQPFTTHPSLDTLLKIHPVERFGCTPCHDGQGPALQSVKYAHGFDKHWLHPLLSDDFVEGGCNKCHAQELRLEHAPKLNRAKRMLVDLGCFGCHEIKGFENAEKTGPDLTRIAKKVEPQWIYGWLRDNKEYRPHTRMPNPQLTEEEAAASVAYLFSYNKNDDWTPHSTTFQGDPAEGELLVSTLGCNGCHNTSPEDRDLRANDLPYDIAPDLSTVAKKTTSEWIFSWIKDPKHYNPTTRMPDLRLSDREAADITAYIKQLGSQHTVPANYTANLPDLNDPKLISEGRAIIRNFGCHGCHVIPGMENEGRVSVSLNEFGGKARDELFFGDALANGDVPDDDWTSWTIGKMKNSRLYATEAVIQRMPNFHLSEEDAISFAALLRSWEGRAVGKRYVKDWTGRDERINEGRLLARKYNCTGCHIIEGEGGEIAPLLTDVLVKQGMDEISASAYAPPNLIGEGMKVQSEWLFNFLKAPRTGQIRPWLETRMPTFEFSDQEANALVEYFKALDDEVSGFTYLPDFELTPEQRTGAVTLFSDDYFDCASCHQLGAKKPEGPPSGWAPDLNHAKDRLNPKWIADWIRDPQSLYPGTRMPSFYPDAYPGDVLDGNPERQISALRNYLLELGN